MRKEIIEVIEKITKKTYLFTSIVIGVTGCMMYSDYTNAMAKDMQTDTNEETVIEERYQGNNLLYTYYGFANMEGVWYNFIEGSVNTEYTGMGPAETGWSYFVNGVQSFTYTGMGQNEAGWWYYNNGNLDFTYTGQYVNAGYRYYIVNGHAENIVECNTISCWGDSMTAGVGATGGVINTDKGQQFVEHADYPKDLETLTGYNVNNYGFPGADSAAIAGGAYQYYTDHKDTNDILILEYGSNGGWDNNYETLVNQYRAVIDKADTTQYIILGDTDDPGLSADDNQSEYIDDDKTEYVGHNETKWESALSKAFGDHFFNTRLYMLDNGLTDNGLNHTQEDIDMIKKGNIPSVLRSDWTHFNNYGYYSKALGVYKKGKELGYW